MGSRKKVLSVVEIIDDPNPMLEEMKNGCLVITQEVNVHIYKSGEKHK
ncbi:MAG: hypothetical protein ACOCPW_03110 [Marinilabiliaceae bacterium]